MSAADWQTWALPAALGILVLLAMRHWRGLRERLERGRTREAPDGPAPRRRKAPPASLEAAEFDRQPLADAPSEVLRWQVEMHETARQLKAELDTKMAALQVLLRDADRQARRLEEAIAVVRRSGADDDPSPAAEFPSLSASQTPPAHRAPIAVDAARQAVLLSASMGRSAAAIAAELDLPLGEVEFLLNLHGGGPADDERQAESFK